MMVLGDVHVRVPAVGRHVCGRISVIRRTFEKASLEWCRGNSKVWENPVRENTTHYTVGYTCKVVLRSYLALGCERTLSVILPAEGWPYLYIWTVCPCIYAYVI
jgi:hypothetical protein